MTAHDALGSMLDSLRSEIVFPTTPPLVEAVTDRIAAPPVPRRSPWRMVAAAAAIAVILTAVIPTTRRAVADLIGIGPLEITQVADLTPASTVRSLGQLTTLDDAAEAASFNLVGLNQVEPDAVFVDFTVPGGMVTLAYGSPTDGWRLLITQLDGTATEGLIGKEIGSGTEIQQVTVGGAPGLWIEGAPHTLVVLDTEGNPLRDRARLAGSTLVTTRHGVLVRIEADTTLAEALAVAERLVPVDR
ncbi:MAG: hypothetical protein ACR2JP_08620 [Acidimicrobiia bacterium]